MNLQKLHFHLVYVGNDRFQLTVTHIDKPRTPLIEIMTLGDLQRSLRKMKPGAKTIRFAKTTIDCVNSPLPGGLRGYFQDVLDSYLRAKATGRDIDAEIKGIGSPDLTDGTGNFSLN